jgi:predicted DsbA family dithiol-disulfide isomerase
MLAHLRQVAHQLGLPFGDRPMTFNSRRAQELGKWAEAAGRGEAFHRAAFHAYFADGLNIALPSVLTGIAADAGLDPDDAHTVIARGSFAEAVDRDWQRSRALGITAVPTFVKNNRKLVGAQTYQDLVRFIAAEENGLF